MAKLISFSSTMIFNKYFPLRWRTSSGIRKSVGFLKGRSDFLNRALKGSGGQHLARDFANEIERINTVVVRLNSELHWRKKNPGFFNHFFGRRPGEVEEPWEN